jgi:hypothetical protein
MNIVDKAINTQRVNSAAYTQAQSLGAYEPNIVGVYHNTGYSVKTGRMASLSSTGYAGATAPISTRLPYGYGLRVLSNGERGFF